MHIPPPIVAAIAVLVLYLLARALPGLSVELPGHWGIGLVVAGLGLGVVVATFRRFVGVGTTIQPNVPEKATTLVTDGPNRVSRNPMYLGMAMIIAGLGVGWATLTTPLVLAGFVWFINVRQIVPEESALERVFGEDYLAYKARVRRWI